MWTEKWMQKKMWLNAAKISIADIAPMVDHIEWGKIRKKRKKEARRCITRKQISAFTTKCTRMKLEISQQRVDKEYLWSRIALGNLFEKEPSKDEVALLVERKGAIPKRRNRAWASAFPFHSSVLFTSSFSKKYRTSLAFAEEHLLEPHHCSHVAANGIPWLKWQLAGN